MRNREMKRMLAEVSKLTPAQRSVMQQALREQGEAAQAVEVVQARMGSLPACPHCGCKHVVRNGQVSELQRFKCRGCAKTFNALTGTPLARLRHKSRWLSQADALREGLSVHKAAERLQVAPSTAFRWRHRFLRLPQDVKAQTLAGVVEADETYFLRSRKGQQVIGRAKRRRGGSAAKRGLSDEQVPVLVARDRTGATTDFILPVADKAHELAVLASVLPSDAILCTDGGGALGAVARHLGIEHHVLNMSTGPRVQGPWHIQNVNAYHGRLKQWMQRFNGVATSYLASYLGWFRACDRPNRTPGNHPSMLALAVGA